MQRPTHSFSLSGMIISAARSCRSFNREEPVETLTRPLTASPHTWPSAAFSVSGSGSMRSLVPVLHALGSFFKTGLVQRKPKDETPVHCVWGGSYLDSPCAAPRTRRLPPKDTSHFHQPETRCDSEMRSPNSSKEAMEALNLTSTPQTLTSRTLKP